MDTEIPQGWRSIPLRLACEPTPIWNPLREPRDDFWYVDVSAVSRERLSIQTPQRVRAAQAPSRARKIIQTGDAVFATVRPTLRRIAFVEQQYDDQIASTAFCIVRANPKEAVPRFLYYALQTNSFNEEIAKFQSGASYPAVNDKDVLNQIIPLPPKPEQEKIAAVLWQIQRAIEVEDKLVASARELKQSSMRQLFTHGLRNESQKETENGSFPESWKFHRLGDIAERVTKGASPRWQGFEYCNEGVLFVRSQNIGWGRLELNERVFLPPAFNLKEKKSILLTGDVLINLVGASIGRVALADESVAGANTNQAVCMVSLPPEPLSAAFLVCYLLSQKGQEMIQFSIKSVARENVSLDDVRNFVVPVPTMLEQQEIAAILQKIDQKISVHERKRAALADLFQTMLHELMTARIRVDKLDIDTSTVAASERDNS